MPAPPEALTVSAVEWVDPPAPTKGRQPLVTDEMVEALRRRPGKWARLVKGTGSKSMRQRLIGKYPDIEFTLRAVSVDRHSRKTFDLYGRCP